MVASNGGLTFAKIAVIISTLRNFKVQNAK